MKNQVLILALFFAFATNIFAQEKNIDMEFLGVERIELDLSISGVEIGSSPSADVLVKGHFDESEVTAKIWKDGSTLYIDEKLLLKQADGQHSEWTLLIPNGMEINADMRGGQMEVKDFSGKIDGHCGTGGLTLTNFKGDAEWGCGTGDFVFENVEGKFTMNTGTGSYRINKMKGELSANTGTGKFKIYDSQGGFNANSGTGNVYASNIIVEESSTFNSGTGDVEVKLGSSTHADLTVNSGTGDSKLELNGHSLSGTLTMQCSEKNGDISAPFDFDKTWTKGMGRNATLLKCKTFSEEEIDVKVGTGTGDAVVTK